MATVYEHPEVPLDRPLTDQQRELLLRIVKSNGGGVAVGGYGHFTIKGLVDRHLVQGKAGDESVMVHTREGLKLVRALKGET